MKRNTIIVYLTLVILLANVVVQVGWTGTWFDDLNLFDQPREFNSLALEYSWVYENWDFRIRHTVQYTYNEEAGTGYQIRIVVHYGSGSSYGDDVYLNCKCQEDFDDIRFADDEGTELNYWMELCLLADSATFWVKLEQDVSYGTQYLFVYYGNPLASTTSDGSATFLFFDDFGLERETYTWTNISSGSGSASYALQNGELHFDLEATSAGAVYGYDLWSDRTWSTASFAMYAKARWIGLDDYRGFATFLLPGFLDNDGHYTSWLYQIYGDYRFRTACVVDNTAIDTNNPSDTGDSDGSMEVYYYINGNNYDLAVDGEYDEQRVGISPTALNAPFRVRLHSSIQSTPYSSNSVYNTYVDTFFDTVYVRKWVPDEPNHLYWSSEETNPAYHEDLSAWSNWKPHIIKHASGAGTNCLMHFVVFAGWGGDTGESVFLCNQGKKSDFSDVRFVDSRGRSLDFFRYNIHPTNYAHFWVEILDDLSDEDSTVYVYYGNANAVDRSDGDATFLFFDGFDGTSIDESKWDLVRGTVTVANGILRMEDNTDGLILSSDWTGYTYTIEARVMAKRDVSSGYWAAIWAHEKGFDSYKYSKGYMFTYYKNAYGITGSIAYECTGTGLSQKDTGTTFYDNSYWDIEINAKNAYPTDYYSDVSHGLAFYDNTYYSGGIGLGKGTLSDFYVDFIGVRKLVENEPQHGAWRQAGGFRLSSDDFHCTGVDMITHSDFEGDYDDWILVNGAFGNPPLVDDSNTHNWALNLIGNGSNTCIIEQRKTQPSYSSQINAVRGCNVGFSFLFKGNIPEYLENNFGRAIIQYKLPGDNTWVSIVGDWVESKEIQYFEDYDWSIANVQAYIPVNIEGIAFLIEVRRFDAQEIDINIDSVDVHLLTDCRICDTPDYLLGATFGKATLVVTIDRLSSEDGYMIDIGSTLYALSYGEYGIYALRTSLSFEGGADFALKSAAESNNIAWNTLNDFHQYSQDQLREAADAFSIELTILLGVTCLLPPLSSIPGIILIFAKLGMTSYLMMGWDDSHPANSITAEYGPILSPEPNFPYVTDGTLVTTWNINPHYWDNSRFLRIHAEVDWGRVVYEQNGYNFMYAATSSLDVFVWAPS